MKFNELCEGLFRSHHVEISYIKWTKDAVAKNYNIEGGNFNE
jgi:hypothetical protein